MKLNHILKSNKKFIWQILFYPAEIQDLKDFLKGSKMSFVINLKKTN